MVVVLQHQRTRFGRAALVRHDRRMILHQHVVVEQRQPAGFDQFPLPVHFGAWKTMS